MENPDINLFNLTKTITYHQILTNPILDIAAHFWERERYKAFKILYRSFRIVDDLVDNNKSINGNLSRYEIKRLDMAVDNWINTINNKKPQDPIQKHLFETIKKYQIPMWPWNNFSKSMKYDLHNNGFKTFNTFLKYAEGASIAPASIFIHLCGISKENGRFHKPNFDIKKTAKPAALFAYIVHIIRDFQKDQINNLNYFADDLIKENGLNRLILKDIAAGGEISSGFRNLIKKYYEYAEFYRQKTRETIDKIFIYFKPQYHLSIEILYNLYLQVFERIDINNGRFTTNELNPSPQEIKDRINFTISKFK